MTDKHFVSSEDVPTQLFDWGTLKWMSTPEVTGSERFSAGVVQLEPGKGHERHTRDGVEHIDFPGMLALYDRFTQEVDRATPTSWDWAGSDAS